MEDASQMARAVSRPEQTEEFPIDSALYFKEALGFFKDWVTSLITLQTAAIGAIAAFLKVESGTILSRGQALIIYGAIACFIFSIIAGGLGLYMLPGCAQRKLAPNQDIYAMKTKGPFRLGDWARIFWAGFVAGLICSPVSSSCAPLPFEPAPSDYIT